MIVKSKKTDAKKSVSASGIRNSSIVLNTLTSADIEASRGVYVVGNTVSGTLTVKNNSYLICDQNEGADGGSTTKGHIYLKSAFNVEVSDNDYRGLEMSKALKKLMSKSITGSDVAE